MKTSDKICSASLATTVLFLFLFFFSFTASADSFMITESRITSSGSANLPDIHGDNIVWQDSDYGYTNLTVYNISTHGETQIITNLLTVPREPKIYGDRIVWIDSKNGSYDEYGNYDTYDIYLYNLSTSEKTQITTSGSTFWPTVPEIYGDRIVWSESRNGNGNVYMYDLSTQKESQITNNGEPERPAVYNDKIVWEQVESSTAGGDICCQRNDAYVHDISTNNTTKIVTSEANYYRVAIYGDKIAWQSWINGDSDIHVYDLSTGKDTQITNNGVAFCPDIYGDRIVWSDSRNGNGDIYLYNTSTSEETQVTTEISDQTYPAIYADRIVWEDRGDIYLANITYTGTILTTPHVANFSSNVTMGYCPLKVQFTDHSENATEWMWNFGDGNTSTEQNPVHTYSEAGTYIVKLIINSKNSKYSTFDTINVLPTSPCAYIANSDGTVSVIETAANKVIATINVGADPQGVAVSPDGTKVYVTNGGSNNVCVIDTATNTVVASVDVGNYPQSAAASPDGKYVYVANIGDSTISVIDTTINVVTETVPVWAFPSEISVTPDGKEIYLTHERNNTVSVIDTTTNTVTATVKVGNEPSEFADRYIGVAVSPNGKKVYVASYVSGTLSIIDTATNTVSGVVNIEWAKGIAVSPDGTKVYVTDNGNGNVYVVDTAGNNVIATVPVGSLPYGIAVTPDGTKVYVANNMDSTVSVIDTASNNVTATIKVGSNPISFGQFIGEKPLPEPLFPVSNLSDNATTEANIEQEPEQTQSSNSSGKENTKTPGFEITSGVICLLVALQYKQNKKRLD